jgi:alpha-ketoglutarate-dependent taurine dioxygenase
MNVAKVRMRATARPCMLLCASLLGQFAGPLLVGWLNDRLAPMVRGVRHTLLDAGPHLCVASAALCFLFAANIGGGYSACRSGNRNVKRRRPVGEQSAMNSPSKTRRGSGGIIVAGRPMPAFNEIEVEPLTGAAGCEIKGVDLTKPLPGGVLEEIMRAFEHFLVIMLRDQDLTPEQHKGFSRHFGEIIELPQAPTYGEHHDMQEVRREAHEPVSVVPFHPLPHGQPVPRAAAAVHGDAGARRTPLRRRHGLRQHVPRLRRAVRWIQEDRRRLEGRVFGKGHLGEECQARSGQAAALARKPRITPRISSRAPTPRFAAIRRPVERRCTSRRRISSDSKAGATRTAAASSNNWVRLPYRLQYQCRIRWLPNTLIVWDNRFLQHCGMHDYANERRHLIRTTIRGERPI